VIPIAAKCEDDDTVWARVEELARHDRADAGQMV
jgi:hypothetical protein